MDFDISVDIAAQPDVVWAVISDTERWHEWTESVRGIRLLDKGPLRVGSRRPPRATHARHYKPLSRVRGRSG